MGRSGLRERRRPGRPRLGQRLVLEFFRKAGRDPIAVIARSCLSSRACPRFSILWNDPVGVSGGGREVCFGRQMRWCRRHYTLPLSIPANPASLERIRFAVLKVSCVDLNRLQKAIDLAKIDWRDVLVAADFASDLTAHTSWWPDLPER